MEKKVSKPKKQQDKKEESGKKAPPEKGAEESIAVTAAKVIGTAAGKAASLVTAAPENPQPAKSQKIGKLPKKNKARLPRRLKRAKQKAAPRL